MNGIVIDARFFSNLKRILEILMIVLDLIDGDEPPEGFKSLGALLKDEYKGTGPFREQVKEYQALSKLSEQITPENNPSILVPTLMTPPGRNPHGKY